MPKLSELTKTERTEVCRSIARAAHACLSKKEDENGAIEGGTFDARLYKKVSELGIIEDDEFFGNSFSAERIDVLKGFEETYEEALTIGAQYDDALVPMGDIAVGFAMPSHVLVRMYCVSRYSATLMGDGPFADLRVALAVADEDGANDENDENDGSDDDDDDDDDENDSIVATSSDDDDDDDEQEGSGSENGEEGEEEDIEEVQPEDAEEPDGPRRAKKKQRVEEVEEEDTDDD